MHPVKGKPTWDVSGRFKVSRHLRKGNEWGKLVCFFSMTNSIEIEDGMEIRRKGMGWCGKICDHNRLHRAEERIPIKDFFINKGCSHEVRRCKNQGEAVIGEVLRSKGRGEGDFTFNGMSTEGTPCYNKGKGEGRKEAHQKLARALSHPQGKRKISNVAVILLQPQVKWKGGKRKRATRPSEVLID